MKKSFVAVFLSLLVTRALAEMPAPIPLWPDGAPGALGTNDWDIPTLTPYLPGSTNGALPHQSGPAMAAMVICPGGAYTHLSVPEGRDYALWLNQHGIAGFVLKYRLGTNGYGPAAVLADGSRAMRWVRAHADEFNLDPHRVGLMGSSAGGHVTSTIITHFDAGDTNATDPVERQSSRPDVAVLCYPVITMTEEYAHKGSRRYLLGTNPAPDVVKEFSAELHVKTNTPPCFIWQTAEDRTVSVENSLMFAEALRRAGVPFDLHIYERGKHGQGLGDKPPFAHPLPWADECLRWLKGQGFMTE
jgi:acetyl esterase/lipase